MELEVTVSNLIAHLAELTKKTSNFDQLRQLLPLVSELKRTETNNKEMNDIIGVMSEAMTQIRATKGSKGRVGSTYSALFDRMMGQLNGQMNKLQSSLKNLQSKRQHNFQHVEDEGKSESQRVIKQVKNAVASEKKKIKEILGKQQTQLSLTSQSFQKDTLRMNLLKDKMESQRNIQLVRDCEVKMGEICCYSDILLAGEQEKNFKRGIEDFIKQSQQHFEHQYPFVIDNLRKFPKLKTLSDYEYTLFCQFHNWGNRLKIALQSSILRVSKGLRESYLHLKNKTILTRWQQAVQKWQVMLVTVKQLLQ